MPFPQDLFLDDNETTGSRSSRPVEQKTQRSEFRSIPSQQNQKNWSFALVNDGGDKILRLKNGTRAMSLRFDGDVTKDGFAAGQAIPMTRLGDVSDKEFLDGDSVFSKGVFQIHKSAPGMIHATMQDGKNGLTMMFEEGKGGKWTMIPKPKTRLSQVAGNFMKEVSGVKTAEEKLIPGYNSPLDEVRGEGDWGLQREGDWGRGRGETGLILGAEGPGLERSVRMRDIDQWGRRFANDNNLLRDAEARTPTADKDRLFLENKAKQLDLGPSSPQGWLSTPGHQAIAALGAGSVLMGLYNHFKYRKEKEKTASEKKRFFHGSPLADIKNLRAGSYVTPDLHIAEVMGRYHQDTGKTWTDDDLAEPYYFKGEPKWKKEPKGKPLIYEVEASDDQLDKLDNPIEHRVLVELPSRLMKEAKTAEKKKVYAVDLDGTLAHKDPGPFDPNEIGKPIPLMRKLVRLWIRQGHEVRIFTARAADPKNIPPIKKWLEENGMEGLEVTNKKTPDIDTFYDDRAVAVERNTGKLAFLSNVFKVADGERKKKKNDYSVPVALGLTGAGVGLMTARNEMFSARDAAQFSQANGFLDEMASPIPPQQKVDLYINRMGDAARGKIWGYTPMQAMKAIRSLPEWIIGSGNQWKGDDISGRHYDLFSKGPISSYREEIPEGYGYDSISKKQVFTPAADDLTRDETLSRFDSAVSSLSHRLGVNQPLDKMVLTDQQKVYSALRDHVSKEDPQLSKTLNRLESNTAPLLARNMAGYSRTVDNAFSLREGLRGVGAVATGAGAALGSYWLWRKFKHYQAERGGKKINPITINLPIGNASIKLAQASSYLAILRDRFSKANKDVHPAPTEAQKKNQNYSMGHMWVNGLDITIETAKGGIRSGVDKDGNKWSVKLKNAYGYIRNYKRSESDGDHVDVFVGPHLSSEIVYVIDQNVGGKFDECKCMLAFFTEKEAKDAYIANFDENWKGFRSITALTMRQFKEWLKKGDTSKPLAGQQYSDFLKTAGVATSIIKAIEPAVSKARFVSRVPEGQAFFQSPTAAIANIGRLGFKGPNLGKWTNPVRYGATAAIIAPPVYAAGHAYNKLRNSVDGVMKADGVRDGDEPFVEPGLGDNIADLFSPRSEPLKNRPLNPTEEWGNNFANHPLKWLASLFSKSENIKKLNDGALKIIKDEGIIGLKNSLTFSGTPGQIVGSIFSPIPKALSYLVGPQIDKPNVASDSFNLIKELWAAKNKKEGSDETPNPHPILSSITHSFVASNPINATALGAIRGGLVGAAIHALRKTKAEILDEKKKIPTWGDDIGAGLMIGSGTGLATWAAPHMLEKYYDYADNMKTPHKAAHIMDTVLAPLSAPIAIAPFMGAGYGAIAGGAKGVFNRVKKKIMGETEEDDEVKQNIIEGALTGAQQASMGSIMNAQYKQVEDQKALAAKQTPRLNIIHNTIGRR